MENPYKFHLPCSILICGPSSCGKTVFISKLILNDMFDPPPKSIFWIYKHLDMENADVLQRVTFLKKLPDISAIPKESLLIIDDQMNSTTETIMEIFTRYVHHSQISIIFVLQNLYYPSKFLRTIHLNSNYLVLFKNFRDQNQITCLNRQIFPGNPGFLLQALNDCAKQTYNPLIIDLKPNTNDNLRIRANVFPGERTIFYSS